MTDSKIRRHFSAKMRDVNSAFIASTLQPTEATLVGFILQDHFSMMGFTAAVDAIVTANLVSSSPLFTYKTFTIKSPLIKSDLGIEISADATIEQLNGSNEARPKILIVCGGFRCTTEENSALSLQLKQAAMQGAIMGGVWNGAIALAYAGLLDHQNCALHPDNHAFMQERFPLVTTSTDAHVTENNRISCAGPISALQMMLDQIERLYGKPITRAIQEILSCDQLSESSITPASQIPNTPDLPKNLRELIALMTTNIEEPLSAEELSNLIGISRRHSERLFQNHLDTSPRRYYLELRITHARRLLLQTNDSITNIAVASGFISTSHFSNCYKKYFGISPTVARENG